MGGSGSCEGGSVPCCARHAAPATLPLPTLTVILDTVSTATLDTVSMVVVRVGEGPVVANSNNA